MRGDLGALLRADALAALGVERAHEAHDPRREDHRDGDHDDEGRERDVARRAERAGRLQEHERGGDARARCRRRCARTPTAAQPARSRTISAVALRRLRRGARRRVASAARGRRRGLRRAPDQRAAGGDEHGGERQRVGEPQPGRAQREQQRGDEQPGAERDLDRRAAGAEARRDALLLGQQQPRDRGTPARRTRRAASRRRSRGAPSSGSTPMRRPRRRRDARHERDLRRAMHAPGAARHAGDVSGHASGRPRAGWPRPRRSAIGASASRRQRHDAGGVGEQDAAERDQHEARDDRREVGLRTHRRCCSRGGRSRPRPTGRPTAGPRGRSGRRSSGSVVADVEVAEPDVGVDEQRAPPRPRASVCSTKSTSTPPAAALEHVDAAHADLDVGRDAHAAGRRRGRPRPCRRRGRSGGRPAGRSAPRRSTTSWPGAELVARRRPPRPSRAGRCFSP